MDYCRWCVLLEVPELEFSSPRELAGDGTLTTQQKIELLTAWERNTRQYQAARAYDVSVNLGGGCDLKLLLKAIHRALASIEGRTTLR